MTEDCISKYYLTGNSAVGGFFVGGLLSILQNRNRGQDTGLHFILWGGISAFLSGLAGHIHSQSITCSPENYFNTFNNRNWKLMLMPTDYARISSRYNTKTDIALSFAERHDIFSLRDENTLDALIKDCQKTPCKDGNVFLGGLDFGWGSDNFIATYKTPSGDQKTGIFAPITHNGWKVPADAEKIIEFVNNQQPKIDFCGAYRKRNDGVKHYETACKGNGAAKIQLLSAETMESFAERIGLKRD